MSQVKVYARRSLIEQERTRLSDAIHASLVSAIGLPMEKRFQRFIGFDDADIIAPADRSERYVIIEISMFEGRSDAAKHALLTELVHRIASDCAITPQDIEITIFETPKANWSIRGHTATDLSLNYRVDV